MNAASPPTAPPRCRRRTKIVVAILSLAILYALHVPLLRGVWNHLVVAAPLQPADVGLVSQSTIDETVAALRRGGFKRLLIVAADSTRTSSLGITPSPTDELRHLLQVRGVAMHLVDVQPTPDDRADSAAPAEAIARYLADRPGVTLGVIVERHRSRFWSTVLDRALQEPLRSRVAVVAAERSRFDESRWWNDRLAVQAAAQQYLQLGFLYWRGTPPTSRPRWSVEALEAAVARGDRL